MAITKSRYLMVFCAMSVILFFVASANAGIFVTSANDGALLVDFGCSDTTLIQSGWNGFEETQDTQSASQTFAADFGIGGTLDVSVACNTFRKRGAGTGPQADLLNDFCRATSNAYGDSFVELVLTNLEPGVYDFTSYNYNSNASATRGNINILVDDSLGLRTVFSDLAQDNLDLDLVPNPAAHTFSFTVDAGGTATITFQSTSTDPNDTASTAVLNGFELASADVPEPSMLLLLAAGGLTLIGVRRRWSVR